MAVAAPHRRVRLPGPVGWRPGPRAAVLAIAVLALAPRLALAIGAPSTPIGGDPGVYDRIAASIAGGHGWPRFDARLRLDPHAQPSALHPPAWPYLLGGAYALTGHGTALDQGPAWKGNAHSVRHRAGLARARARWLVGRVLNAVLGSVSVALLGLIALELWGPTAGIAAAALAALYPASAILGVALLSEPLFVAFELAALLAVLRHRRSPHGWRWLVAAGVLTGLAVLTRANGAALLLPFALAVWTLRPRWSPRALAAPAALVAVTLATLLPWTVRNAVVLHAAVPVSTDFGQTVAGTYNPLAAADRYRWRSQRRLPPSYARATSQPTEVGRDRALTRLAFDYIEAHPAAVLEASAYNTARLLELDPGGRSSLAGEVGSSTLGRVSVLGFAAFAALALAGMLTRRARRAPPFVWLVPVVMWLTTVLLATNLSRFRAPIDPFVVLLAALGVVRCLRADDHEEARWPKRAG